MRPDAREVTLDVLLDFVKRARGFDFTGYKRATIERRVEKRMGELGLDRYEDYIDHLELHAEEFVALFNTILINVTGFFRDPQTWEYLASEVVPELLSSRPLDAQLRIWCAGCASGEEAYTVAMVLASALGEASFLDRVKIYATDVDAEALDTARHGAYPVRLLENVPRDALERFFERTDQGYVFRRDLRRAVIFGRNDLVQDAPISRIDLLVCRNTLMYFNAETQARILRRFHFALDDEGMLLLGKSEMLITHADLFRPKDVKRRVFHKVARPSMRDRVRVMAADLATAAATPSVAQTLRDGALDLAPTAQIVIDREGLLVLANDHARRMLGLEVNDIGRAIQDLDVSYRPVDLRARLDRIAQDPVPISIDGVRWRSHAGRERVLDVRLAPVASEGELLGTAVAFIDVTDAFRAQTELRESNRALEETREELQSTVEELETTNEELQSTNEELETTNEELRSTNEELETMNDELRERTFELNDVNAFLEAILTTIGLAVAVLDRRQRVQLWNGEARDLWGLTPEEAEGQHILGLDIGLPVEELRPLLRAAQNGDGERQQITLDAVNRRGKPIRCAVSCLPLSATNDGEVTAIIVMMEPFAA